MKVLYVIATLGGGGAESQLCYFVDYLKQSHQEISFDVCALKSGGILEKRLKHSNVRYFINHTGSLMQNAMQLHRIIKEGQYDLIHAHMLYADIVCRFASICLPVKVIATHHGLGKWKSKPLILFDRLTKHLVDGFITVSDESKKLRIRREKYPKDKTTVIYNGIPSFYFTNEAKCLGKKIIIGTIARFTDNKQIDMMIKIMNDLRDNPDLSLEIIGDGEKSGQLHELTEELGLTERVRFWGWQDDILPIICHWHIFLMCSINEDLPVSMLEAMAQGIVPVASTVGGIPEILDQGKNGMLCNSQDRATFVEGIKELITDPKAYEIKSSKCEEYVQKHFSIRESVQQTINLYHKILGE